MGRPGDTDGSSGTRDTGVVVGADMDGVRLDRAVRELFDLPWSVARKRIEQGKISVDGSPVLELGAPVRSGCVVATNMTARRARPMTDLPPDAIVHLDGHVVVVNKPAGVTTIPFGERKGGTLDERVRAHIARIPGVKKERGRVPLGIVHRIDQITSGLVVFTRTWKAKTALAAQFRDHGVHRLYMAVAIGDMDGGSITSHLVADRGDGKRGSVEAAPPRLRPGLGTGTVAITHVHVERRLAGATLLTCRLETGRTHQIRIHLAEAGHPLVGERVYGRQVSGLVDIPAARPMLHAAELGFKHPGTGRWMQFSQPMPDDMTELIERLERR